jgi:DNA-binding IclR family transcriptional regulator
MDAAIVDDVMPAARAAVHAALIRMHTLEGRATVRGISRLVGCSISTCHHHLLRLRRVGLIAWEPERQGTLRPLVEPRPVA